MPSAFETIEGRGYAARRSAEGSAGALALTRVNVFEQVERLACQLNEIPADLKCLLN